MDISPENFVRLVLPVYKAMFEQLPTTAMLAASMLGPLKPTAEEARRIITLKHYTSVSFGRLLVLAERQLRLTQAYSEAALEAIIENSGLTLAPALQQEQVSFPLRRPHVFSFKPHRLLTEANEILHEQSVQYRHMHPLEAQHFDSSFSKTLQISCNLFSLDANVLPCG